MVIIAVLGLLMAGYATCTPNAHADSMLLPRGTTIQIPGQPLVTLDATHYVVTRPELDRANAAAATSARLTRQLTACTRTVVRVTRPEPGWRIAGRWALIGGAVVGAFVAGAML